MAKLVIGVISDTHIPIKAKQIPADVFSAFAGVDSIVHAGDVFERWVIDELSSIAPCVGVMGNGDPFELSPLLPVEREEMFGEVPVAVIHDSGGEVGRRQRLRRQFPKARVVIFGHSHMPVIEDDGELLLLNPGSACDPRRSPSPSVAVMRIEGTEVSAELITFPRRTNSGRSRGLI